jgi:hypothetical protein
MVTCTECERTIAKLPRWLSSANVKFVCEDCRQKHPHQWISTDIVEPVTEEAQGEPEEESMEVPFSQVQKELLKQEGEEEEESEYELGFDDVDEEEVEE